MYIISPISTLARCVVARSKVASARTMGGEETMVATGAFGERASMDNIRQGRSITVALQVVVFDEKKSNYGKVPMADVVW